MNAMFYYVTAKLDWTYFRLISKFFLALTYYMHIDDQGNPKMNCLGYNCLTQIR